MDNKISKNPILKQQSSKSWSYKREKRKGNKDDKKKIPNQSYKREERKMMNKPW